MSVGFLCWCLFCLLPPLLHLLHGACFDYVPGWLLLPLLEDGPSPILISSSFPLLFICRVSLSSSPSNLHQTKLYAVFVSTCLSSQTIPVWVIDDDHSLSPDTPPCWDKHCKHGLLSCTIFVLFFVFFLHSVGFGFGLLLLTPYLTAVNYHQGWVDLVLSLFLECVLVTSIHIRSRHTYIQTDRYRLVDDSYFYLKTATFTAYLLLILFMFCYYTNSQNGMVGGMVAWCYTTAL